MLPYGTRLAKAWDNGCQTSLPLVPSGCKVSSLLKVQLGGLWLCLNAVRACILDVQSCDVAHILARVLDRLKVDHSIKPLLLVRTLILNTSGTRQTETRLVAKLFTLEI